VCVRPKCERQIVERPLIYQISFRNGFVIHLPKSDTTQETDQTLRLHFHSFTETASHARSSVPQENRSRSNMMDSIDHTVVV